MSSHAELLLVMSAEMNMKTMSQSSSGIPLPRTLSKHDTKSLRGPAGERTVLSSSTSSISSLSVSKDFLKGTGLRNQSSLRAQGNRPSSAPRSAQNSPHVLKRENTYLKNTRDLRRGSLPQDGFRDMERLSNQNWRSGHHHFRSLDNEEESGQALRKPTNGNVIWETSAGIQRDFQKQRVKMQTRGDGDRGRTASKPQIGVTNTCPEGRESPRMAHVAPFRFRWDVSFLAVGLYWTCCRYLIVHAQFLHFYHLNDFAIIWCSLEVQLSC